MAFQNGQTESDIQGLTTGASVTENQFRRGLNSVIEKANVAPRDLTVNGTPVTRDENDNWSVSIQANDNRLPAIPDEDTGTLELTLVGNEFVWQPRVPFGDYQFPSIDVGGGVMQPLFTVGDAVRSEGQVVPRLIANPRLSASTTNTPSGSSVFARTVQSGSFALQATAQTLPVFEDFWANGMAAPAGNYGTYIMNEPTTRTQILAGPIGNAISLNQLDALVQSLSGGEVRAAISTGRITSARSYASVTITLTGLTSSFIDSYPIIGVYGQTSPYSGGSNGGGVWVNLTDYSIHGGAGSPSSPNFGGLSINRGSSALSGSDPNGPGIIINDVSVPAVRLPLTLNTTALQAAAGVGSGTTLPTVIPAAGRIFTLTAVDGANMPGVYYSDGTQWVGS